MARAYPRWPLADYQAAVARRPRPERWQITRFVEGLGHAIAWGERLQCTPPGRMIWCYLVPDDPALRKQHSDPCGLGAQMQLVYYPDLELPPEQRPPPSQFVPEFVPEEILAVGGVEVTACFFSLAGDLRYWHTLADIALIDMRAGRPVSSEGRMALSLLLRDGKAPDPALSNDELWRAAADYVRDPWPEDEREYVAEQADRLREPQQAAMAAAIERMLDLALPHTRRDVRPAQ